MNIPTETKPALWGIVGGAVAMAIVGFMWMGWVTGGKAEQVASDRASAAVVKALAPICVERFQGASGAAANLTTLQKAESWTRGDLVEKGGWATLPGSVAPDQVTAVAKACALLLAS
jgi:hypothetical protein